MADPTTGVALVSGASRGIGRELALGLAAEGMSVGLLGRDGTALDDVRRQVTAAGGQAVAVPADVTIAEQVRAAVDIVADQLGPVDLLVSNAGLRERGSARPWESDPDDWWRVVETNVRGPFLLAHAVLPDMVDRGAGRVLHVGSGMGSSAQPEWSAYGTSKAALTRFTESLAAALAGTGVMVLEASPGLVRTDMTETMWGPAQDQPWNPVQRMVEVVLRFARGDLDALHGRFVHAVRDELDVLLAAETAVVGGDVRTVRLQPYGEDAPPG